MEYLYAFLIGGAICVIGQILMDATKLTAPRVLVILVIAGALLQAFNGNCSDRGEGTSSRFWI